LFVGRIFTGCVMYADVSIVVTVLFWAQKIVEFVKMWALSGLSNSIHSKVS